MENDNSQTTAVTFLPEDDCLSEGRRGWNNFKDFWQDYAHNKAKRELLGNLRGLAQPRLPTEPSNPEDDEARPTD